MELIVYFLEILIINILVSIIECFITSKGVARKAILFVSGIRGDIIPSTAFIAYYFLYNDTFTIKFVAILSKKDLRLLYALFCVCHFSLANEKGIIFFA